MTCTIGLLAEDCLIAHWSPALDGRRERAQWRAPCPVCHAERALEYDAPGRAVRWKHFCPCDRTVVRKALLDLVGGCVSGRGMRMQQADIKTAEALLLDRSVTVNALRLGCLRALDMPEKEIRERLGLPRATYYDAVRILGHRRR